MNGELAELVALVAHGNAWLADMGHTRAEMSDFEASNSTFQFAREVTFELPLRRRRTSDVRSVTEWLEGASRLKIGRLSLIAGNSKIVTFANEGLWGILGHGRDAAVAWYGRWEVNRSNVDPGDPRPRIWKVIYRSQRRDDRVDSFPVDLPGRSRQLREALERLIEVARGADVLSTFIPWFEDALELASSNEPTVMWQPDILPASGYTIEARQLMAMAVRSWVFGGMGSWNDAGFTDAATAESYRIVTERLYQAVIDAIRAATNSFSYA